MCQVNFVCVLCSFKNFSFSFLLCMLYGMFLILKITKVRSILEEYCHYVLVFSHLLDAHNISKSSSESC